MQLTLERPDWKYVLRGADGASALVNERRLTSGFIVATDALIDDWGVTDVATLTVDSVAPMLSMEPDVIVLGTGERQVFAPPAVLAHCLQRGVGIEAMTNAAAARTFNVLAGEGRRVVAGFVFSPRA